MNGMDMLLRSFGVDPKEIMVKAQEIMNAVSTVGTELRAMRERLDRIERALNIEPAPGAAEYGPQENVRSITHAKL